MRLHSTFGIGLPHEVPEGGLTIRGHTLLPGTVVSVPTYIVHRDGMRGSKPRHVEVLIILGSLVRRYDIVLEDPKAPIERHEGVVTAV
ncbi:hypothetical protein OF83DRAFT_1171481 [Amylostereum chailletii]|nr:hypothetical protein OF83DRAFT_1171481 [Amylostereum chailletii]